MSELTNRPTQQARLLALFLAHPLREFSHDELKAAVGDNFKARLCQLPIWRQIVLVPKYRVLNGRKFRTYGAYRWDPTPTAVTETPENTGAPPVGEAGLLFQAVTSHRYECVTQRDGNAESVTADDIVDKC